MATVGVVVGIQWFSVVWWAFSGPTQQLQKEREKTVYYISTEMTQPSFIFLDLYERHEYISILQLNCTGVLTSLANSDRVLRLRFPPKPLRRPTTNWPLSVTVLICDRPLNTVPTRLVSTTKSF